MQAVLGIDAAWTPRNPSGVALAANRHSRWQLVALSPSYQCFRDYAEGRGAQTHAPAGSWPDAKGLLASAFRLLERPVDLVAVDIPLARGPIVGRRISDNAVSKEYGSRKCATHTPSAERPGLISEALTIGFAQAGYALQTHSISTPGLIEVYPHPALVELASATERLPYKVSRASQYWPTLTATDRRARLVQQWTTIVTVLENRIDGVERALPTLRPDSSLSALKSYEDMLDAAVCAAVAICALEGCATPFGDDESAIWIPNRSD